MNEKRGDGVAGVLLLLLLAFVFGAGYLVGGVVARCP